MVLLLWQHIPHYVNVLISNSIFLIFAVLLCDAGRVAVKDFF